MASWLPGDIIYLIVGILGEDRDFNSLFQCAVSAKCFTEQAVTTIYKSHELSPVRGGGTELAILDSTHTRRKWATMWRSIVLSALDQTYLPYYSYIRYLDLNDLSNLLSHSSFTGKIKDEFFTPELRDLVSQDYELKGSKRLRSLRTLPDSDWILSKIGAVLEVLVLTDSIPAPRNEDFYSTVSRVADWIGTCKALQHLELRRFVDDTYLLARILVAEDFKLLSLSLTGYTMVGSRHFHRALGSQDSLLRLSLRGEGSEIPEDNELLVQACCQLHNLHELELKDISDYFTPDHLMSLTPHLPHLEKLWIGGDLFNDDVWNAFLCLPKLRSLAIHALSEFTAQGILDFIAQLGPGNTGMSLMILNSITSLTEEAQSLIRDILKHNLDGTFDFGLAQEEFSDADTEVMSD
ncbi:hypothetical protein KXW18_003127 [Aspergillus fumigatus]|nr:hypothetical protein KXW88_008320 [Aspergillus fumigatus]KAH3140381.1 hypothetical protein KXW18_003127 [Aspergillus fumigatus]KAH3274269.1 hypothetical protein KXW55_007945 [Aspergillus fumigatus]